ncbi:hypothetical protein FDP41_006527 [Naegleria fowleri]|uniref:Uncharacterized protein n=1 Tax=Naegleria fowleri TaxID=5763 RepID=A0A6A5BLQ6_NAEFO|nr:uncharacterized protein FDP41_006527 [Naegleria fowleri]KAF0974495.1 hypothetical protein FDP41_006527 [Naegleria fowleri]CAG4716988.1 unnamed protein product [Naegleria fowleri]
MAKRKKEQTVSSTDHEEEDDPETTTSSNKTNDEEKETKKVKMSSQPQQQQPNLPRSSSTSSDENPIHTKLKELDSCVNFKTIKEFEDTFTSITDYLFNHVELIVKDKTFRLAEVEYYYTCPPVHNDPFSHCHELQATKGEWYFHQSLAKTNDNNYKGGSYQGLDITIGCGKFKGGVLIRSLLDGEKLIEGPSLCVDAIINTYDCKTIHEFVTKHFPKQKHFAALDTKSAFYLKPKATPTSDKFVRSGRVGLTLKQKTNEKERVQYIFKPYRYCLKPEKMKKGKHLMAIVLYKELLEKGETDVVKKVEKMIGTSGLGKYFTIFEGKKDSAFGSVSDIDPGKLTDYTKDLNTQQTYELAGILTNVFM